MRRSWVLARIQWSGCEILQPSSRYGGQQRWRAFSKEATSPSTSAAAKASTAADANTPGNTAGAPSFPETPSVSVSSATSQNVNALVEGRDLNDLHENNHMPLVAPHGALAKNTSREANLESNEIEQYNSSKFVNQKDSSIRDSMETTSKNGNNIREDEDGVKQATNSKVSDEDSPVELLRPPVEATSLNNEKGQPRPQSKRPKKAKGQLSLEGIFTIFETTKAGEDSATMEVVSSKLRFRPPKEVSTLYEMTRKNAIVAQFSESRGAIWRGDFQQGRLLLTGVSREFNNRFEKRMRYDTPLDTFNSLRRKRAELTARTSLLMLEVGPNFELRAKNPPKDSQDVLKYALGDEFANRQFLIPFPEFIGMQSGMHWNKTGIEVPALGKNDFRIYPEYSVFPPTRQEYVPLLKEIKFPKGLSQVIEVGTGTGVLTAMLLSKCGVSKIIGTDTNPRAVKNTHDTLAALGLADRAQLIHAPLLPPDVKGDVEAIICNPPWIPGRAGSVLSSAIYDENGQFLPRFLKAAASQIKPDTGRIYLFMSDLAEKISLRPGNYLSELFEKHNLEVVEKIDAPVKNPKLHTDGRELTLHDLRSTEVISLYSLRKASKL